MSSVDHPQRLLHEPLMLQLWACLAAMPSQAATLVSDNDAVMLKLSAVLAVPWHQWLMLLWPVAEYINSMLPVLTQASGNAAENQSLAKAARPLNGCHH